MGRSRGIASRIIGGASLFALCPVVVGCSASYWSDGAPRLSTASVDNITVDWDVSMNGTGTWSIEKDDQDPPVIELHYDRASLPAFDPDTAATDESASDYDELLSIDQNHLNGLFLFAGDPDEKFRFILHKAKD